MKKILLGTTAVALAGVYAAPASAEGVELKIGGFTESWIGYANSDVDGPVDVDVNGVDAKFDGEIEFVPSITLDNGIKIGANIQLEVRADARGAGTADIIDEAYLFVRGSFGELLVGDENSAGYKMSFAAPDVSFLGINSPSTTIFVPYSGSIGLRGRGSGLFRQTLGTTFVENNGNNDSGRITYFTPRFAGFQVGASYARDDTRDTVVQVDNFGRTTKDIFDVGANYVNSFGGVDVAVSGRWGRANNSGPGTPTIFGFGANLGYAGVTVGGSFAEQNDGGLTDGTAWDIGVSYETGPWGFSVTYFSGENVDDEFGTGGNAGQNGNDEERTAIIGAVSYDLAKGVDLNLVGGYEDFEEDTGDLGFSGDDVSGFYIATGLRLRF